MMCNKFNGPCRFGGQCECSEISRTSKLAWLWRVENWDDESVEPLEGLFNHTCFRDPRKTNFHFTDPKLADLLASASRTSLGLPSLPLRLPAVLLDTRGINLWGFMYGGVGYNMRSIRIGRVVKRKV